MVFISPQLFVGGVFIGGNKGFWSEGNSLLGLRNIGFEKGNGSLGLLSLKSDIPVQYHYWH